jgi:oligopeptide transport system ATP-binding protein
MADMNKPLLEVKNLKTFFKTRNGIVKAVNDVSYSIYPGKTLGIVGESGSGKSVSAMSVLRLLDANGYIAGGTVTFDGQDLSKVTTEQMYHIRGNRISVIFQEPMTSLNPVFSVKKQLSEPFIIHQGMSKKEAAAKCIEMLKAVQIPNPEAVAKQYPHQLSGGMRQRVMIAMALACKPDILIADEPTTALDVTIQAQILELIKAMQKKYDLTTIYITHDLGVVANVADRIAVMYAGDIVELGTCDEVFYDPRHPYTWALLSSLPQLGTKDEPLYSIQGTPPNLFHEVKGDAFAPRNPKALKIDFVERPPFFEVTPTHYARTWLMDPRAPKVEPPEHVRILREKGVNRVG